MDLLPKEYKTKENANGSLPGSGSGKFDLKSVDLSRLTDVGQSLTRPGIIICSILMVAALTLWGGMFYYKNSLTDQIIGLKDKQSKVFSDKDKETALKIINLEKSSESAKELLISHNFVSEFFNKLAAATLPQVQWRSLNLLAAERSLKLGGAASNYSVLAKQILALRESGFLNVSVSKIKLDKLGGVAFEAGLNFDPKFLRK
ncbi:MAG: hypothetical protein PHT44_00615 [Candidatus Portnoybacteria bacterium]|nr:hypothetical protein [Candidatus Portnoybacteria bacterium]MDD4982883.1 hypothetical protein [Candidatus Portnoybacteria bacterium]